MPKFFLPSMGRSQFLIRSMLLSFIGSFLFSFVPERFSVYLFLPIVWAANELAQSRGKDVESLKNTPALTPDIYTASLSFTAVCFFVADFSNYVRVQNIFTAFGLIACGISIIPYLYLLFEKGALSFSTGDNSQNINTKETLMNKEDIEKHSLIIAAALLGLAIVFSQIIAPYELKTTERAIVRLNTVTGKTTLCMYHGKDKFFSCK